MSGSLNNGPVFRKPILSDDAQTIRMEAAGIASLLAAGDPDFKLVTRSRSAPAAVAASDPINGGSGNDTLVGAAGNDIINGLGGDDYLRGLGGDDTLNGGDGNDTLDGGDGKNMIDGGAGINTVSFKDVSVGVQAGLADVEFGSSGEAVAYDLKYLSLDADGNLLSPVDTSYAAITNITGSALKDNLTGNDGDNHLDGGAGSDILQGNSGNDIIDPGAGPQTSYADTVSRADIVKAAGRFANSPASAVLINSGPGGDFDTNLSTEITNPVAIQLTDSQAVPHATVRATGNGTVDMYKVFLQPGTVFLDVEHAVLNDGKGGTFEAHISVRNAAGELLDGPAGASDGSGQFKFSDQSLIGDDGRLDPIAPIIVATAGYFYITVSQPLDQSATAGIPKGATYSLNISDPTASVTPTGGHSDGYEILNGGSFYRPDGYDGSGPAGNDTVTFASAASGVSVDLGSRDVQQTGGAGKVQLFNFDNVTGSRFNDLLLGDANANVVNGGSGNDTLVGGGGADTLTGGAGNDLFVFKAASDSTVAAPDVITDFRKGQDKIDLTAVHTSVADKFSIATSGGNSFLNVDLRGNGTTDLRIQVNGTNALTAADVLWTASAGKAG